MNNRMLLENKLDDLYDKRLSLAEELDQAYVGGSISKYLSLEERYAQLSLMIEQIVSQMRGSGTKAA